MKKNLVLLFFLLAFSGIYAQETLSDSLITDSTSQISVPLDSLPEPASLRERKVDLAPQINDNSQKTGRVIVRVCVNANGDVIEAEYIYEGSNTADSRLVELAINNAKRWKFKKAAIEKQCGTIKYDFKLKD